MIRNSILAFFILCYCLNAQTPTAEMIMPEDGSNDVHNFSPIILETNYDIDMSTILDECPEKTVNDDIQGMGIYLIEKSLKDSYSQDHYSYLAIGCYVEIEGFNKIRIMPTHALKPGVDYSVYVKYDAFRVWVPDAFGVLESTPIGSMEKEFTTKKGLYQVISNNNDEIKGDNESINCCAEFELFLNQPLNLSLFDLNGSDVFKLYKELDPLPGTIDPVYREEVTCNVTFSESNTKVTIDPTNDLDGNEIYTLQADLAIINGNYSGNYSNNYGTKDDAVIKLTKINSSGNPFMDNIKLIPGPYKYVVKKNEDLVFSAPFETENYYLKEVINPLVDGGYQLPDENGEFRTTLSCCNLKNTEIVMVYEEIPQFCVTVQPPIVLENFTGLPLTASTTVIGFSSQNGNSYCGKRYSDSPMVATLEDPNEDYEFVEWITDSDIGFDSANKVVIDNNRLKEMMSGAARHSNITITPVIRQLQRNPCQQINYKINVVYEDDPFLNDQYVDVLDFIEVLRMAEDGEILQDVALIPESPESCFATYTVAGPWNPAQNVKVNTYIKIKDNYPFEIGSIKLGDDSYVGERNFPDINSDEIFTKRLGNSHTFAINKSSEASNCNKEVTVYIRRKVKYYNLSIVRKNNKELPSLNLVDIFANPTPPKEINFPKELAALLEGKWGNGINVIRHYPHTFLPDQEEPPYVQYSAGVYFYEGTTVELNPSIEEGSGWQYYKWNDNVSYDVGIDNGNNGFTMLMDESKNSQLIIQEEFKLKYVAIPSPTIYKLDENGNSILKSDSEKFIRYKVNGEDANKDYEPLDNTVHDDYSSGAGVWFETYPEHFGLEQRPYQFNMMKIRFEFNQTVDPSSLHGNLYLEDIGIYTKGVGTEQGLRPDGYLPQIYHPRVLSILPEHANDPKYKYPNCEFKNSEIEGEMLSGNMVEMAAESYNHSNQEIYWMTAMNKFSITIINDINDEPSSRIRSADGGALTNCNMKSETTPWMTRRVTAPPGIVVNAHGFQLADKYKGDNMFIHELATLNDETPDVVKVDKSPVWKLDEHGRVVFDVETGYYPNSTGDYWNNAHHWHDVTERPDNNQIFGGEYISGKDVFNIEYFIFCRPSFFSQALYEHIINPVATALTGELEAFLEDGANSILEHKDLDLDLKAVYESLNLESFFKHDRNRLHANYVLESEHHFFGSNQSGFKAPRRFNQFRHDNLLFGIEDIAFNGEIAAASDVRFWGVGPYGLYQSWSYNVCNWGKFIDINGNIINLGEETGEAKIIITVGDL